mgnify:FL=1
MHYAKNVNVIIKSIEFIELIKDYKIGIRQLNLGIYALV